MTRRAATCVGKILKTAKALGPTIPLTTLYFDQVADEAREAPFRQQLAGRPPGG